MIACPGIVPEPSAFGRSTQSESEPFPTRRHRLHRACDAFTKAEIVKRPALYLRVSTVAQNPETQGIELRQFAQQRGYEIVHEYVIALLTFEHQGSAV
jgi:hypothetical protein